MPAPPQAARRQPRNPHRKPGRVHPARFPYAAPPRPHPALPLPRTLSPPPRATGAPYYGAMLDSPHRARFPTPPRAISHPVRTAPDGGKAWRIDGGSARLLTVF